jgi:hypothetical protein
MDQAFRHSSQTPPHALRSPMVEKAQALAESSQANS